MFTKLSKIAVVLALTVAGSAVAMQQATKPAAPARTRPEKICRNGVCRLVQPAPAAAKQAVAPVTAAAVPAARGAMVAPAAATQGKYTIGVTPAQQAANREAFTKRIQQGKAPVAPAKVATPASGTRIDTSKMVPISVPK